MFSLDLIQTVAFAGLVLFAGYGIRRGVPVLARYNIPAPVIGGLLVAGVLSFAASRGVTLVTFDTTLQAPLMIAFFTSVGFGASVALLRVGGPLVLMFFGIATLAAIVQNVVGALLAAALGQPALMGVLAGSVTLTGGPATGLAFAPQFEAAGVPAAGTLALAAAMVGIVSGGVVGGPVATWLIARRRLATPKATPVHIPLVTAQSIVEEQMHEAPARAPEGEDREAYTLLKTLVVMLVAMWVGGVISAWINRTLAGVGMALPAYIGAMLAAAVIRNVDDATKLVGISQQIVDDLGNVALSLFLVLALMTLRLYEIVHVALPLIIIVVVQVASSWLSPSGRLPHDGARLRRRGDRERLLRLHAWHDGERHGQHGGDRRTLWARPAGVPGGADGRRLLHRLHERAGDYGVSESAAMTISGEGRP